MVALFKLQLLKLIFNLCEVVGKILPLTFLSRTIIFSFWSFIIVVSSPSLNILELVLSLICSNAGSMLINHTTLSAWRLWYLVVAIFTTVLHVQGNPNFEFLVWKLWLLMANGREWVVFCIPLVTRERWSDTIWVAGWRIWGQEHWQLVCAVSWSPSPTSLGSYSAESFPLSSLHLQLPCVMPYFLFSLFRESKETQNINAGRVTALQMWLGGGWLISFWHLSLNTQLLCTTN